MASRRNRNRTQRKNKNKNRSRKHRGGAASISCNNAQRIINDPSSGMVKKMAARVQLKSCATGSQSVTPNKSWYNARAREGEQGVWDEKVSPTGTRVVPVKSCGNAGIGANGTCANSSQAKSYNYVE